MNATISNTKYIYLIDSMPIMYHIFQNHHLNTVNKYETGNYISDGFLQTINRIIQQQKPTHLACTFDIKKPTFRHLLYNKYKAHRRAMPNDIQVALPIIKNNLKENNISAFELEGFEADDIIGTIANKASEENFEVVIISPDKDFFQLVNENISLSKLTKSGRELKKIGLNEVRNRFVINNPSQLIDIMALCGDKTDNIPGLSGIGYKNARKLIMQYGSIEEIFRKPEILNLKYFELFQKNKEIIELSKKLVTIDINVPINFNLDQLKLNIE